MLRLAERSMGCGTDPSGSLPASAREHSATASPAAALARKILLDVLPFRRIAGPPTACALSPCEDCLSPHLPKVVSAIERNQPIPFVLPAFPGKSPNPAKVLGRLPDMAERRALEFLQYLCDRI